VSELSSKGALITCSENGRVQGEPVTGYATQDKPEMIKGVGGAEASS
jgi:hypothetical protein